MLIVFLLMIVGPVIAKRFVAIPSGIPLDLLQPTGQNNNDTLGSSDTGTALLGGGPAATGATGGRGGDSGAGGNAAATTASPFDRFRYI